jgi:hypothetical protein
MSVLRGLEVTHDRQGSWVADFQLSGISAVRTKSSSENRRRERAPPLTPTDRRLFLRFPGSQRVKECITSENVETRLVMGRGFVGHTLQYDQMRCRFRSSIPRNELRLRVWLLKNDDPGRLHQTLGISHPYPNRL